MKNKVKHILKLIKNDLRIFYKEVSPSNNKVKHSIQKILSEKTNTIIILGTPEHGNLGDQAIAFAEIEFLKKNFPDYQIIDVCNENVPIIINTINAFKHQNLAVFIHGGGNIGNIYIYAEKIRRKIVEKITDVPIISFPQSMIFETNSIGKKELKKSKSSYEKNNNFILCAREPISYKKMKENFNNSTILTPDIVFSLDLTYNEKREDVLFLLRSDIEEFVSIDSINIVEELLLAYEMKVNKSDTHIGNVKIKNEKTREKLVLDKLKQISKHKLVVTDRLHGMIFSYITGTPCLVFKNNNHKIESTYDYWLKDVKFIKFSDMSIIDSQIKSLLESDIEIKKENFINHDEYIFCIKKVMNIDE